MRKACYRLRSARAIEALYRRGRRISTKSGMLFLYGANNESHTRCAVIVSKKFSLSAVARNRQRRVITAAIEPLLQRISLGHDIILLYTKKGKVVSYKDAQDDIIYALTKAGIYK